jgi:alpha-amylase/alpha-mannosidase (GH57 family)
VVSGIVPRYRRLEAAGQIELSTSPFHHPIAPLLIDFGSAREARPGLALPDGPRYPGGGERVAAQLRAALDSHARRFGRRPDGLWPPEGAVSTALVDALAGSGLRWIASGSQVLENSLRAAGARVDAEKETTYRPYRLSGPAPDLVCLFRDDRLSDLIGFEYRKWHSDDAAEHFQRELESILASAAPGTRPVATVIVDGENAWEYYPYNGFFFLSGLYQRLAAHRSIRPRTCRELLAARQQAIDAGLPDCARELPRLVAGSWVYGDLTTWIGAPDKNRAWDLLVAAKEAYDRVLAGDRLDEAERAAATRQLAICEASDWFWWFGDDHPAESVAEFDALYRDHLAHLYELLALPAPGALGDPVSRGNVNAVSTGTIRRAV